MSQAGVVAIVVMSLSSAAAPAEGNYAVTRTTTRSVEEFAECFVAEQGKAGNAWWFVPSDNGGVLSNAGAAAVRNSYRLQMIDLGKVRSLRLEPAIRSSPPEPPVALAIDRCL